MLIFHRKQFTYSTILLLNGKDIVTSYSYICKKLYLEFPKVKLHLIQNTKCSINIIKFSCSYQWVSMSTLNFVLSEQNIKKGLLSTHGLPQKGHKSRP